MSNPEFYPPTKIVVGKSAVHGLGVFATELIQPGELVERCPMVPLNFRSNYHKDTKLYDYLYLNGEHSQESEQHGFIMCMVLGYGMIYNHQDRPNANWKFNWVENYADLVAQRLIRKGEEIFTSYGEYYFTTRTKVQQQPCQKIVARPIFRKK